MKIKENKREKNLWLHDLEQGTIFRYTDRGDDHLYLLVAKDYNDEEGCLIFSLNNNDYFIDYGLGAEVEMYPDAYVVI